jgi:penicillin-binding protein 2
VTLQALYDGPPPLEAYPSNLRDEIAAQQKRIENHVARGTTSSDRA